MRDLQLFYPATLTVCCDRHLSATATDQEGHRHTEWGEKLHLSYALQVTFGNDLPKPRGSGNSIPQATAEATWQAVIQSEITEIYYIK